MQIIDKYAGKHAKTLFWVFVIAILFSIAVLPLWLNIQSVWINTEWVLERIGISSLAGRVITAIAFAVLALIALRVLSIFVALGIRLAYATPIHWRIDNTLSKLVETAQRVYDTASDDNDKLEAVKVQAELETICADWNSSAVTRFVRWVVINRRKD